MTNNECCDYFENIEFELKIILTYLHGSARDKWITLRVFLTYKIYRVMGVSYEKLESIEILDAPAYGPFVKKHLSQLFHKLGVIGVFQYVNFLVFK